MLLTIMQITFKKETESKKKESEKKKKSTYTKEHRGSTGCSVGHVSFPGPLACCALVSTQCVRPLKAHPSVCLEHHTTADAMLIINE